MLLRFLLSVILPRLRRLLMFLRRTLLILRIVLVRVSFFVLLFLRIRIVESPCCCVLLLCFSTLLFMFLSHLRRCILEFYSLYYSYHAS